MPGCGTVIVSCAAGQTALIVMATGGTGGHIYPAVATARELMGRGHRALLLGQRGGMEERFAADSGLEFHGVDAGKLARSGQGRPDPRELLRAARGVAEARAFLARRDGPAPRFPSELFPVGGGGGPSGAAMAGVRQRHRRRNAVASLRE